MSILRTVVLPAPFGPRKPYISPLRDGQVYSVDGLDAAEVSCEAVGLDRVLVQCSIPPGHRQPVNASTGARAGRDRG